MLQNKGKTVIMRKNKEVEEYYFALFSSEFGWWKQTNKKSKKNTTELNT